MFILKRKFFLPIIFVFFLSVFIYSLTLAPSIVPGDGPELITAAYNWGTAHPPGYPLLTVLSKIFITLFPIGNIAWRVNLLNALFGSLTVAVIYLIIYRLTKRVLPAVVGSLFLAFSSSFWLYSITADVFTLNNLFGALLILTLLIWHEKVIGKEKNRRWLYLFCFFAGLSFTNQEAIVFLAPAFLFLILVTDKKVFIELKTISLMVLFLVLGLTPYLYLLIASSFGSTFYWSNPNNLRRLIGVILREGYGGVSANLKVSLSLTDAWASSFWFYLKSLYTQFTIVGFALALLGFRYFFQRRKLFVYFLIAFLFSGSIFLVYLGDMKLENPIMEAVGERMMLLSGVFFSIFIGYGVNFLIERIFPYLRFSKVKFFASSFIFSLFLFPLLIHYPFVNQKGPSILYDFGQEILNQADKDSLIITKGDMMFFSFLYLQNVESKRQDVKVIHRPFLKAGWYIDYLKKKYPDIVIPFEEVKENEDIGAKIKELINANINQMSIYFPILEEVEKFKPEYFMLQREFVFQLFKGKPKFTTEDYIKQNENSYQVSQFSKNIDFYKNRAGLSKKYPFYDWYNELIMNYATSHNNKCLLLYDLNFLKEAKEECKTAINTVPDFVPAYFNFGSIYLKEKEYEKAIEAYERIIQIDPTNLKAFNHIIAIYTNNLNDEKKAAEYLEKYKKNREN